MARVQIPDSQNEAEFLHHSALDAGGWIIYCRGRPGHWRRLSNIPGFHPLDASSASVRCDKCLQTLPSVPWRQNHFCWEPLIYLSSSAPAAWLPSPCCRHSAGVVALGLATPGMRDFFCLRRACMATRGSHAHPHGQALCLVVGAAVCPPVQRTDDAATPDRKA